MAYIAYSDFRSASLAEYCANLSLATADASDANLTSSIARFSQRFDDYTNDHFEAEVVALSLSGDNECDLDLPKRCTAITSITITDQAGTATAQASTAYRLVSSLYASGSKRLEPDREDYVELVYGAGGLTGYPISHYNPYTWPTDANCIAVTGSFGWNTTPGDVKRAVALMVWDHFKGQRGDLRRAARYQTADVTVEVADTTPTGIPEVDQIIADYKRDTYSVIG